MEDRIVDGDWGTILGVLEDIFRCEDGMEPKGEKVRGVECPYFGRYVGVFGCEKNLDDNVEEEEKKLEEVERNVREIDKINDLYVGSPPPARRASPDENNSNNNNGGIFDLAPHDIHGPRDVLGPVRDLAPSPTRRAGGIRLERDVATNDLATMVSTST